MSFVSMSKPNRMETGLSRHGLEQVRQGRKCNQKRARLLKRLEEEFFLNGGKVKGVKAHRLLPSQVRAIEERELRAAREEAAMAMVIAAARSGGNWQQAFEAYVAIG
jgi:hypothetical protein